MAWSGRRWPIDGIGTPRRHIGRDARTGESPIATPIGVTIPRSPPMSPTTSVLDAPTHESALPRATFGALPLVCENCGAGFDPEPSAICLTCLGPLVPSYDPAR